MSTKTTSVRFSANEVRKIADGNEIHRRALEQAQATARADNRELSGDWTAKVDRKTGAHIIVFDFKDV